MINRLRKFIRNKSVFIDKIPVLHDHVLNDLKSPKVNLGQLQAFCNNQKDSISNLSDVEF